MVIWLHWYQRSHDSYIISAKKYLAVLSLISVFFFLSFFFCLYFLCHSKLTKTMQKSAMKLRKKVNKVEQRHGVVVESLRLTNRYLNSEISGSRDLKDSRSHLPRPRVLTWRPVTPFGWLIVCSIGRPCWLGRQLNLMASMQTCFSCSISSLAFVVRSA